MTIAFFMIGVLLLVCIVLTLGFAWRLWRLDEPTRAGWLLVVADTLVFTLLILLLAVGTLPASGPGSCCWGWSWLRPCCPRAGISAGLGATLMAGPSGGVT